MSSLRGTMGLLLTVLAAVFIEVVDGKGVGVRYIPDTKSPTRTYPSQTRGYYYRYYMDYFTPSGMRYAKLDRDNNRTVRMCSNYENIFENDTYLGVFPCPMEKDPNSFGWCCGESQYEFCCKALDHPSVKLAIGLGTIAGLAVIFGIVLCVVLKIRGGKQAIDRRRSGRKKMLQMGIPKYETYKTGDFVATQSEDGYQIVVKFNRTKTFYNKFWEELYRRNKTLAWKFGDGNSVKEAKLTLAEGKWVSLVLSDEFDGRPLMLVSREKAAVDWMENDFENICASLTADPSCWNCYGRLNKAKTHPCKDENPAAHGVVRAHENGHRRENDPKHPKEGKDRKKDASRDKSHDRSPNRSRSRERSHDRAKDKDRKKKYREKGVSNGKTPKSTIPWPDKEL